MRRDFGAIPQTTHLALIATGLPLLSFDPATPVWLVLVVYAWWQQSVVVEREEARVR